MKRLCDLPGFITRRIFCKFSPVTAQLAYRRAAAGDFVCAKEEAKRSENRALRGTVADFERVKRAFGPEKVERAVEKTKRQEQAEKEQQRAKRKFNRGAR